jgi:hypothetical protein
MKYLITREQFLSRSTGSNMINEVLEAPITWGGSLIGRMVNSAIRRVKIGYNESQIDQVIVDLRNELDYLLSASITGDAEKKLHDFIVKDFFQKIKDISLSTDDGNDQLEDEKLEKLIGASVGLYDPKDPKKHRNKVKGLMKKALKTLREDLPGLEKIMGSDREKMLNLLSDFTDELRKLTYRDNSGNLLDPGGNLSEINYNRQTTIQVLDDLKKLITSQNISRTESLKLFGFYEFLESLDSQSEENKTSDDKTSDDKSVESDNSDQSNSSADDKNKKDSEVKKPISNPEVKTNNNKDVNDLKLKIENIKQLISNHKSELDLKNDQKLKDLINQVLNKIKSGNNADAKTTINNKEVTYLEYLGNFLKYLNSETNESLLFENVKNRPKSVKEVWEIFFAALDAKEPHRLTDREKKEFDEMMKDPESISKYYVYDPSSRPDPIISISRVFTNAYNLFATDYIPSGRPKGRISQKTLREYIKLGPKKSISIDENGGTIPGEGPWAVKKTFNKFRDGVTKILQDQEYRKILANMKFVTPGAEDKFNESFLILENEKSPTNSSKESHGQILLRYMNDMITPSKLGDFEGMTNTYISEYFGVKLSKKQQANFEPVGLEVEASEGDRSDELTWQPKSPISLFKSDSGSEFKLFAFPSKYLENFPDTVLNKIKDSSSQISLLKSDINKKNKILFINRVSGIDDISIDSSSGSMKFYPIKVTFNNPLVAKKSSEKEGKKLEDWTYDSPSNKNSIHYGFINFIDDNNVYLVHSSVAEDGTDKPIDKIYIQKLKIGDDIINERVNAVLINVDGKIYSTNDDFTSNGEQNPSKDNFDKQKNSKKLVDIIKEEMKRIFG